MRTAQYLVAVEHNPSPTTSQNLRTESLLPGVGRVTGLFCAQWAIFPNGRWWTGAGQCGSRFYLEQWPTHRVCWVHWSFLVRRKKQWEGSQDFLGPWTPDSRRVKCEVWMTHCLCWVHWSFLFIFGPVIWIKRFWLIGQNYQLGRR